MELSASRTEIEGLWVVDLKQVEEPRGTVREFYRESSWLAAGLRPLARFLQVNVTETRRGAIRGLHGEQMTKLVGVVAGSAFGAYLDARRDSSTFGKVVTVELAPGRQVLVPEGVCNGFQALEDSQYLYGFDSEWVPGMAGVAVNPLDPDLGIAWPLPVDVENPAQLSAKDRNAPLFRDIP